MDGVHLGHRKLLARAREIARSAGARVVAFTFDPPPGVVLRDRDEEPLLTSLDVRAGLMREAGADEVRVLRFDTRLAAKSPETFLAEHVFPFGRVAALVLGYDFALGHERRGTPEMLAEAGRRWGFSVTTVSAVMDAGVPISSSRIRHALLEGRVEDAARWLGRPYTISGRVERGDGRGKELGFPTANLSLSPRCVRPAMGVYAVWVRGVGPHPVPGVANLGERPTFGGGDARLEVHVLEPVGSLEGTPLSVDLAARLRDEVKFNNINELKDQIARDVSRARAYLQTGQPSP
jgi:riboflavin kinase/FMN adenylyltransferase